MSQGLRAGCSPFAAGGLHCLRVGLRGDEEVIRLAAGVAWRVANRSSRAWGAVAIASPRDRQRREAAQGLSFVLSGPRVPRGETLASTRMREPEPRPRPIQERSLLRHP